MKGQKQLFERVGVSEDCVVTERRREKEDPAQLETAFLSLTGPTKKRQGLKSISCLTK